MAAPVITKSKNRSANTSADAPAKKPATAVIPFVRASRMKSFLSFQTQVTMTAATQVLNPIQMPPAGFLRYVDVEVSCVTASNAATVAFQPDAPFSVLQTIQLANSSGDSIIVTISGYSLFLLNKYGAFAEDPTDPRKNAIYSVTTGSGGTGGSFKMMLRVPAEIDPRDAFCALANLAANKAYQLLLSIAPSTAVYSTAPTTLGTLTITGIAYFWSQPNSENDNKNPQATQPFGNGSVNQVRYQSVQGLGQYIQLVNVGNVIRFLTFVLRNSSGTRAVTDWPALMQLILNNDIIFYKTIDQWQSDMGKDYATWFTAGTIDTAGGLDTGVFVISDFMKNRGEVLADGPRDQYLATLDTTLLQIGAFNWGANAATDQLQVITNEIKPVSAAALYSPNFS